MNKRGRNPEKKGRKENEKLEKWENKGGKENEKGEKKEWKEGKWRKKKELENRTKRGGKKEEEWKKKKKEGSKENKERERNERDSTRARSTEVRQKKKKEKRGIELSTETCFKIMKDIAVNGLGRTLYQLYSGCASIEITQFNSVEEYTQVIILAGDTKHDGYYIV